MGTPDFNPVYDTVQRLESFHALAHNQELLDIAESLLGKPAMPQPGIRARVIFASGIAHTTPPHQDFIFIQGTPEVWTCWIPLGTCPHSMGGLEAASSGSERRKRQNSHGRDQRQTACRNARRAANSHAATAWRRRYRDGSGGGAVR